MCHHDSYTTYCGGCFATKGHIISTQHIEKQKRYTKNKKQELPKKPSSIPLFE